MAKTSKYISSISYNTELFLKQTLDTLIICKVISYYEFIKHFPDKDDKKEHIHVFIIPNKSLDLSVFGDYFIEKDLNNDKPLKCMPFRVTTKYGDWYWYALHDKDYLKAKQMERNTFYSDVDVITADKDFHNVLVCENPLINFAHMSDMVIRNYVFDCVSSGVSLHDLLSSGLIPLGKTQSVCVLYNALSVYSPIKLQNKKIVPKAEDLRGIKKNLTISKIRHAEPLQEEFDLIFDEE